MKYHKVMSTKGGIQFPKACVVANFYHKILGESSFLSLLVVALSGNFTIPVRSVTKPVSFDHALMRVTPRN